MIESLAKDLPGIIGVTLGLLVAVGLGEVLRRTLNTEPETSRRLIHALTGVIAASIPFVLHAPVSAYLLSVAFVLVNLGGVLKGWFPAMHAVRRRSVGTVTFPLALIIAIAACWSTDQGRIFAIPVAFLILAFADPAASLVGTRLGHPRRFRIGRGEKSLEGSVAFFGASFVTSVAVLSWSSGLGMIDWSMGDIVLAALGVAVVTCAAEVLSGGGWDNVSIVVAAIVFLVAYDEYPEDRYHLLGAVGVGVVFTWLTWRWRFLDASGALAGGLLAVTVVGVGGWGWALPSFSFFLLSSLLSKMGKVQKEVVQEQYEKGNVRDAGQVLANGGVGWAMLLGYVMWSEPVLYWGFLGAFAAAAADTWATEVGALSRARPRMITTFQKVPTGTSGAVSIWGIVGALAGAIVVWLVSLPFPIAEASGVNSYAGGFAIIAGGLLASFVDSLAGATIQLQYLDLQRGTYTERSLSGGSPSVMERGIPWMRNDQVNLLCTLSGAAFAAVCYALIG